MEATTPTTENEAVPLELADEENCARPNELVSLEHDHLNTWHMDGRLASAACGLTVQTTDEQIHALDMQRDSAFANGRTDRMVQSLANAALTVWSCTGNTIGSYNAAFDETQIPEEDRPFKAISIARQARIELDNADDMTIGVISRSCEGIIRTRDNEYTFDPAVDRITMVMVASGGIAIGHITLRPKLHHLYDERDLSTCHRFGELVDTAVLHDPYLTAHALLERAIDAQSLQKKDF
jgi:hypothetical protein